MTEKARPEHSWFCVSKRLGVGLRQIRVLLTLKRECDDLTRLEWSMPCFQENPLSFSIIVSVPQTNTGGWDENSKALERTLVKELGKIAP